MKIEDLYIGQSAKLSKRFTDSDVRQFAEISLDKNPVHLNQDYASHSMFKSRIVHCFLSSSLISAIIGTIMPGEGSIYLKQDLNFRKPIYLDELVTAEVTITEIKKDKSIVYLSTNCYNEKNELAVEGSAIIKLLNL